MSFFGISGSGKKIVFIIDATPSMLVDEKGGMDAYDNVKTEVGSMLVNLNRNTQFNILLYDGKKIVCFQDELVPGLPSNLRLAIEWLNPLNREYEALGLGPDYSPSLAVSDFDNHEIQAVDTAHYTKAVQKAMEWQANAIFCIASGWEDMRRSPTPEMREKMANKPSPAATAPSVDESEVEAWRAAVEKTRQWLAKENAAREAKGISPKVVTNFAQLVREVTGARPPTGGNNSSREMRLPNVTPEEVVTHVGKLVNHHYKAAGLDDPALHMVLFLGENEAITNYEKHFQSLTQRNHGKLKILRGLAALQNLTGG